MVLGGSKSNETILVGRGATKGEPAAEERDKQEEGTPQCINLGLIGGKFVCGIGMWVGEWSSGTARGANKHTPSRFSFSWQLWHIHAILSLASLRPKRLWFDGVLFVPPFVRGVGTQVSQW